MGKSLVLSPIYVITTAMLFAVLAGCGSFREREHVDEGRQLRVAASAQLTAWLIADIARRSYRGSDPLPAHDSAPVWRDGRGRFTIELGGGPLVRVALNGRLTPPRLELRGDRLVLAGVRFLPAEAGTRAESGPISIHARVAAVTPNASTVTLRVRGSTHERTVLGHVEAAIAVLDAAETGREPGALSGCCAAHQSLRAPSFFRAHRLREHAGDLPGARNELARALQCAPDSAVLRVELARIESRLARPSDAARTWNALAKTHDMGLAGRALLGRLARTHRRTAATSRAFADLERGQSLVASGDSAAARAWANRCCQVDDGATDRSALLRRLLRIRGAHRAALALGVSKDGEVSHRELAKMASDAVKAGDPTTGLRLLARGLEKHTATTLAETLELCITAAGPELACRVLVSERASNLCGDVLEHWRRVGLPERAALALLGRVSDLRRRNDAPRQPTFDGVARPTIDYDGAPGVAAPPR